MWVALLPSWYEEAPKARNTTGFPKGKIHCRLTLWVPAWEPVFSHSTGDISLAEQNQSGPKTTLRLVVSAAWPLPPHMGGAPAFRPTLVSPRGLPLGSPRPGHLSMLRKQLQTSHFALQKRGSSTSPYFSFMCLIETFLPGFPKSPEGESRSLSPLATSSARGISGIVQPSQPGSCASEGVGKAPGSGR